MIAKFRYNTQQSNSMFKILDDVSKLLHVTKSIITSAFPTTKEFSSLSQLKTGKCCADVVDVDIGRDFLSVCSPIYLAISSLRLSASLVGCKHEVNEHDTKILHFHAGMGVGERVK